MTAIAYGHLDSVPLHVRAMMALGVAAALVCGYLSIGPWRRLRRAGQSAGQTHAAPMNVGPIRLVAAASLMLGLAAAAVGAGGAYFG